MSRTRTVRVPFDATVFPRERGSIGWSVEVAGTLRTGATEKAAVDAAVGTVGRFVTDWEAPHTSMFRGHVAVVYPAMGSADGVQWCGQTTSPDGRSSWYLGSAANQAEAIAQARHSLAQCTTDWQDADSVHDAADYLAGNDRIGYGQYGPTALYRYAAWQRAARAAIDAVRTDYHEWATDHAHEFAVPAR